MPYKQPPKEHQFKRGNKGKIKGTKNFKTIFEEAAIAVATALRLGNKPNAVEIEIVKKGIKQALVGDSSFYKDIMDRLYGKVKESHEIEMPEITKELQETREMLNNMFNGK